MSCRSTPGMNVPMGLARIDSGLEDDQIQSLIHQLRHEYVGAHTHGSGESPHGADTTNDTGEQWRTLRNQLESSVNTHPGLRPQRRAGLLRRIGAADAPPAADMIYAAERIRTRAIQAARILEDHLATEGARLGVPDQEVQNLYASGRAAAPSGRQEWPSDEERQRWRGLPLDPRTRYGLAAVAGRTDNPDGRHELISDHHAPSVTTTEISVTGYHPESQRLEICTTDGMWLTYRNVGSSTAASIQEGSRPVEVFRAELQNNRAHQYRDAAQAAAAGIRRRCSSCGEYTGANHICQHRDQDPAVVQDAYLRSTTGDLQTLEVPGAEGRSATALRIDALPDVANLMEHTDRGEYVTIPVLDDDPRPLIGEFMVTLDEDDQVVVNSSRARCTDPDHANYPGQCRHIHEVSGALRDQLTAAVHQHREQVATGTAAALAAEASAATPSAHTRPASAALLPEAPDRSTFRYSEDPARFAAAVRAVMDSPADQRVPFMTGSEDHPVMYGFGAEREFGVELEYDSYRATATAGQIGRALHAAEFTSTPHINRYHTAQRSGYVRNLRGGWTFEQDGSVAGEVVTPIMSDRPETWERLREACSIISSNGGRSSAATGSHVTISAADQAGMAAKMTRFMRFMHHNQADLHLMATTEHGRGSEYARPLREPPMQGYTRITDLQGQIHRYTYVNVAHIAGRSTDNHAAASRIEFRLWDGSLDASRIQAQVKMSAALVDYSSRNRSLTFTGPRPAGGQLNPDHHDFADQTQQVRGLIDELFRRDEDKQQITRLWATGLMNRSGQRSAI
ncbi:MAG: amidoligase family protein [Nakamurella sp.]